MRHLQHVGVQVDARLQQLLLRAELHVAGQQHPSHRGLRRQHHGVVVELGADVAAERGGHRSDWGEHVESQLRPLQRLTGCELHHGHPVPGSHRLHPPEGVRGQMQRA